MKILHIGPVKNGKQKQPAGSVLNQGLGVDGPSHSILGLAKGLAGLGVQTGILSTKPYDAPAELENLMTFLPSYTGRKYHYFMNVKKWTELILERFGKPDLVNFHDVYDLFSVRLASRLKKLGWPYIVTPRGGLRAFAQQKDSYKKKIANPLFFNRYLRNALRIHALAPKEAEDIQRYDPRLKTIIVPNGIGCEIVEDLLRGLKSIYDFWILKS